MTNNKINILGSLKNVASLMSPKTKAIVYSVATLILYVLITTTAILALLSGANFIVKHETINVVIGILTIFKGVCLTVQQAFNGKNIKQLIQKKTSDTSQGE